MTCGECALYDPFRHRCRGGCSYAGIETGACPNFVDIDEVVE